MVTARVFGNVSCLRLRLFSRWSTSCASFHSVPTKLLNASIRSVFVFDGFGTGAHDYSDWPSHLDGSLDLTQKVTGQRISLVVVRSHLRRTSLQTSHGFLQGGITARGKSCSLLYPSTIVSMMSCIS